MSKLINTEQAAAVLGISKRRIQALAAQGRVSGAVKVGRDWVFPADLQILPGRPVGYPGHRRRGEDVYSEGACELNSKDEIT